MKTIPPEEQVSFAEFADNLRRYYDAEDTSPEEIRRLYDLWQEFIADNDWVRMSERQFRSPTPPTEGLAWWEERWAGKLYAEGYQWIHPMDRVNMLLSSDVRVERGPLPRPHRPEWLRGRWQCVAVSDDGERFSEPAEAQQVLLPADGKVAVRGPDPYRLGGALWSVRLMGSHFISLWLERDGYLCNIWNIEEHQSGEVTLVPPGKVLARHIWRRVDSGAE